MAGRSRSEDLPTLYRLFATPFGTMAALWTPISSGPLFNRILLPAAGGWTGPALRSMHPGSRPSDDPDASGLCSDIAAFLSGKDVKFSLDLMDLYRCPSFQKMVLLAEYGIPRGSVSTYGRISRRIGRPGAARAVGTALARNPFPVVIPCHRALRSDLTLGGYQGGLSMKRRLLEMEGVRFDCSDRADVLDLYY